MKLRRYIGALLFLSLSASAHADNIDQGIGTVSSLIAKGSFVDASVVFPGYYPRRALNVFKSNKLYKQGLLNEVATMDGADLNKFQQAGRAVIEATLNKLISTAESDQAWAGLRAAYVKATLGGSIKATIYDDGEYREVGTDLAPFNVAIVRNTLAPDLALNDQAAENLKAFVMTRAGTVEMKEIIASQLAKANVSLRSLKGPLHELVPAAADALLNDRIKLVHLVSDGEGLLMLDLNDELSKYDDIRIVDVDSLAASHVSIKQIGLTINEIQPSTEIVNIAQTDVNILQAALLMPTNSKYSYSYTHGQVEYEYAFDVTSPDGTHAIIRDHNTAPWSACSNFQVVNVFGGSQPVGWMANSGVADRCKSNPRKSASTVRSDIVRKLAEVIVAAVVAKPHPGV
jgi:hypothetical protein